MTFGEKKSFIDWRHKGFPTTEEIDFDLIIEQQWNILDGDAFLPMLVIKESAISHNLDVVHGYCKDNGFSISPHGKTTMSPEIVARQFAAGSWAITAATVSQAKIFRAFGAPRVLIASEVVEPNSIKWISQQLSDPDFEILCLVDSVDGVKILDTSLGESNGRPRLKVLLELGMVEGRTGCRSLEQVAATVAEIGKSENLALAGVEAFEGVVHYDSDGLKIVDGFLEQVFQTAQRLESQGDFDHVSEIIISAGGSAFPDRVANSFTSKWIGKRPIRIVLRSGCYITHDHGLYERASPFGSRLNTQSLKPALEIWGAVISRPEPNLALLNFGKRDVAYDIDLPTALWIKHRGTNQLNTATGLNIFELNDQHAFIRIDPSIELNVGDFVGAGISHPCTAFDKWRMIPVVADDYQIVSVVSTYF